MIVRESLLQPKPEKEVFDEIFGDQYFFRNKYNKIFTLRLDTGKTIYGGVQAHIENNLKVEKYDTNDGKAIAELSGTLLDFVKHFLSLRWTIPEIVTYLQEQYQAKNFYVS